MATKRKKARVGRRKTRRPVKKARFDTQAVKDYTNATLRIKIFDRKAKKFIRGEWEIGHALAVLNNLIDTPDNAKKFGYVD